MKTDGTRPSVNAEVTIGAKCDLCASSRLTIKSGMYSLFVQCRDCGATFFLPVEQPDYD
jgi:uncharacterized Zn finger protein